MVKFKSNKELEAERAEQGEESAETVDQKLEKLISQYNTLSNQNAEMQQRIDAVAKPNAQDPSGKNKVVGDLGESKSRAQVLKELDAGFPKWSVFSDQPSFQVLIKKTSREFNATSKETESVNPVILEFRRHSGVGTDLPHPNSSFKRGVDIGIIDLAKDSELKKAGISWSDAIQYIKRTASYEKGRVFFGDEAIDLIRTTYTSKWAAEDSASVAPDRVAKRKLLRMQAAQDDAVNSEERPLVGAVQ